MTAVVTTVETAEVRFRAMGTRCHVLVTGPGGAGLLDLAVQRIDELERRWSRFRPDSEISRLNTQLADAQARPRPVSSATLDLCLRAQLAAQRTGGVWNPLVGRTVVGLGYDRSFDAGLEGRGHGRVDAPPPIEALEIDPAAATVWFPSTAAFDAGGIAKGLTADIVSAELMDAGAWGAMVNMGGDLRVRGLPRQGLEWVVSVGARELCPEPLTTVRLPEGAVATSTTLRRRWQNELGDRTHHLVDPATGRPAATPVVVASVVAGEAWWAEVAATALVVRPELELPGCASLQVTRADDGSIEIVRRGDIGVYES